MIILTLLFVPLLICGISFICFKQITWKEALLQLGIQLAVCGIISGIIYYQNIYFKEVWNGQVTKKYSEHVSCSHSYSCNCYTDKNGTHCSTCYEHSYDVDWVVNDTAHQDYRINRIDRQGLNEPPFFSGVQIGDPTSSIHSYKNYIKASSDSLFSTVQEVDPKYKPLMPAYPMSITNYYYLERFVSLAGFELKEIKTYNQRLADLNGKLGVKKECNIILIIIKNMPEQWAEQLRRAWQGGNKNDIISIIAIDKEKQIQWVKVLSMSQSDIFNVSLRDDLLEIEKFDFDKILASLELNINKYYQRQHMQQYSYIDVKPSLPQYIVSLIISMLISIGLSVFMYRNDVFEK